VKLYFGQYVVAVVLPPSLAARARSLLSGRPAAPPAIQTAADVDEALLEEVAARTQGFSGRELAKLLLSVQAAVYGRPPPLRLDAALLREVLEFKLAEHLEKQKWLE
jgi:hypothetical protein